MNRIDQLKQLLQNSPEDPFLQHALALEYIKIGDDALAKTLFQKLLEHDPTYVGSYYHLGKVHERLGEIPESITIYEKGIKVARTLGDHHALNELQAAINAIED